MLIKDKTKLSKSAPQISNWSRIKRLLFSGYDTFMKKFFDNKSFNKIDLKNINSSKH